MNHRFHTSVGGLAVIAAALLTPAPVALGAGDADWPATGTGASNTTASTTARQPIEV